MHAARRLMPAALLLLASAVVGGVASAQAVSASPAATVYTNPVLPHADPSILKWNGEYYLYATGNPIRAYHSTDLVHWREIGPVLSGSTEFGECQRAWMAPEIIA